MHHPALVIPLPQINVAKMHAQVMHSLVYLQDLIPTLGGIK